MVGVVALAATLVVAGTVVSLGGAGSTRTFAAIHVLPHVLTLKSAPAVTQGFIAAEFTNGGPSKVNHVLETITAKGGSDPLPLPPNAFALPAGCAPNASGTGTIITCDLGQVSPGTVQRLISFTVPAGTPTPLSFAAHISVSFDEAKGSQLTDTVTADDFPASIVSTKDGTQKGQCLAGTGGTLTASDKAQQISLDYPGLPTFVVPCTPGAAGAKHDNALGDIAFVDFLDGNGLATVTISISPSVVTKKTLQLIEYANYPDPTPTVGTDGSQFVPSCVNGQIPLTGFHSCVVTVDNLQATLLAQGGTDSGWGHT